MNRMILKRFAIVLVVQAIFAFAQEPAQPAPTFTLTISQVGYGGTTPGNYTVRVKLKNISDHEIGDQGCLALRDWFNVSVIYNGVPMEETDAVRRLKEFRKLTKPCEGSYTGWKIEPGEEHYYRLNVSEFYDMSKPGTYEVTVKRETNPKHPEMSVTVKSNTIATVVP